MLEKIKNFVKEEEGASMVEYGLLVALIAVIAIGGVTAIGNGLDGLFEGVADRLDPPAGETP